jgi:hypothetical protein
MMKIKQSYALRITLLISLMVTPTVLSTRLRADTGTCGAGNTTLPFTDVPATNIFFCSIASAYFTGLTNGTSATTYSPANNVTREQMAAFITRTMDQSLKRGSERAVAKKWWTPQTADSLTLTTVGGLPEQVEFDGTDLWVANRTDGTVMRVRASDGKLLDTWTGGRGIATAIVTAMGRIFVAGPVGFYPGRIYMIDPTQPAGAMTILTSSLGYDPQGITFDGQRIWVADSNGSVSIVSLNPTTVTTVPTGFSRPKGMLYDGSNIWVTDNGANTLLKLSSEGSILQTINVGTGPQFPVFDGTNIWVPNFNSSSVTVVRVKDTLSNPLANPFVLATLTGNGLGTATVAAFDGERILVTNQFESSASLWKAADLTPLGFVPTGDSTRPVGACSDGLNFWIVLRQTGKLARL